MKKKQSFISDINVVNDSIIVEYSDGNTKIESYSYDKYAELLNERHNSIVNFNIKDLNDEIFEGKLRRLIIVFLIGTTVLITNFNIFYLIISALMFFGNEGLIVSLKNTKNSFQKSCFLDNYEEVLQNYIDNDENIKEFVKKEHKESINNWSLEELKELRTKIIDEKNINILNNDKSQKQKIIKK